MVLMSIALTAQHDHLLVLSFSRSVFFFCIPHYRGDYTSSTLKSRLSLILSFVLRCPDRSHISAFLPGFYEFKYIIVLI